VNTEQQSGDKSPYSKDWPHAPIHRLSDVGVFMVTAGTYRKEHFFKGDDRLDLLESSLLRLAKQYGWQLEAWAVFSNHYHFVGRSPMKAESLKQFIAHLHADTAREVNKLDGTPSRKVWHNFWDTRLTFERSYLARLNYVHQNPGHHKLVPMANQYRWCSAAWFERTCPPATVKTIYSFKINQLKVPDDF
jgi:putative transposase